MKNRIVDGSTEQGRNYPIQPIQLETKIQFNGAFLTVDTEKSARILVTLAQKKGGWFPFALEEVSELEEVSKDSKCVFLFHGLNSWTPDEENYIICGEGGLYYFTHKFIIKCAEVALIF